MTLKTKAQSKPLSDAERVLTMGGFTEPMDERPIDKAGLLELTTKVITAYLSNAGNNIEAQKVPDLIDNVYKCLEELSASEPKAQTNSGQIAIKKTIQPEYIICLEDGKKLKMLKRHLRTNFKMSPEEYRAKWSLPSDYPMVAPNYAARRSAFAKKIGLGKPVGSLDKNRDTSFDYS